jgi:hypothetical protein
MSVKWEYDKAHRTFSAYDDGQVAGQVVSDGPRYLFYRCVGDRRELVNVRVLSNSADIGPMLTGAAEYL